MKVKYTGHTNEVVVPNGNDEYFAARNEVIELPDDLAESLLEQSVWEKAQNPKEEKAKEA